jgi:hypothetical protein
MMIADGFSQMRRYLPIKAPGYKSFTFSDEELVGARKGYIVHCTPCTRASLVEEEYLIVSRLEIDILCSCASSSVSYMR